jgi:iron complex outermembrane receptor protein
VFGEATWSVNDRLDLTGGLRWYDFDEDRQQVFDGIFAHDNTGTQVVSQPGSAEADGIVPRLIASWALSDATRLNVQASQGFRLGGINDPLNIPLCTPADLSAFSGYDSWGDETAWNYEVGTKTSISGGGVFNVSAFYMDISDLQATVTAGSCSSRIILNVPKATSQGFELDFSKTVSTNFDFNVALTYTDSELGSTVRDGAGNILPGLVEGNRLPTVPEWQGAASANYQWQMENEWLGYVTGSFQYVGERYTQIADQAAGFGIVNLASFNGGVNTQDPNNIGGPYTQTIFTFDPELPDYQILNLRLGFANAKWDFSGYVNNVTDEQALLALDQERGTRARVGYLVNQPRTFGVTARVNFR